jgi:dTDP-4-amino-4,6-dideoxygalactose transaminase
MSELVQNTERFLRTSGFFGRRHILLVGRGATALMLLYNALSPPGGRIVLPAIACPSLLATVLLTGRSPVIVDVDSNLNIDPQRVRDVVQPGDVVVAVHIFGIPCDIPELEAICLETKAVLIEDAAQAIGGATLTGATRPVGTFGHASIFSFASGKNLPTNGGGAILTDNEELVADLRNRIGDLPRRPDNYKEQSKEQRDVLTDAFNRARCDNPGEASVWASVYEKFRDIYAFRIEPDEVKEIAMSLGMVSEVSRLRRYGAWMYRAFLDIPGVENLEYPDGCSPFRYTFLVPDRSGAEVQDVTGKIRCAGMHASNLYLPLHWLAPDLVETEGCPRAEMAGTRCINLWVNDDIPDRDASKVAELVKNSLKGDR